MQRTPALLFYESALHWSRARYTMRQKKRINECYSGHCDCGYRGWAFSKCPAFSLRLLPLEAQKRKDHSSTVHVCSDTAAIWCCAETLLTRGRRSRAEQVVGVLDLGSLCPRVPAYQRGAQGCGSGGLLRCRFNKQQGQISSSDLESCVVGLLNSVQVFSIHAAVMCRISTVNETRKCHVRKSSSFQQQKSEPW